MSFKSVILAAGMGTRMKSSLPKVLHEANDQPMLEIIDEKLNESGSEENVWVLGHQLDRIVNLLKPESYVCQDEQLGTGHAVLCTEEKLKEYEGDIIVTCGDTPLLTVDTIKKLHTTHVESGNSATILSASVENPTGYGRIVKNHKKVVAIVEEKDCGEIEKRIQEINSGVYFFKGSKLFDTLKNVGNNNANGEYYLTDVIGLLIESGDSVGTLELADSMEILGVNNKLQLACATKELRRRKNEELMLGGVQLIDPDTTYIGNKVEVEMDTTIYPGVTLKGNTKIGKGTTIIGSSYIENSEIGDDNVIKDSYIVEGKTSRGVTIGPFAHIRPNANLKDDVHIGNFVEVKNSTLERGVKSGHLTYLGDSTIGEGTNIGAGTITCNYDGANKHKTTIGKNVFVGSDSILVAPVNLADNSFTAAGSVITKDVPENALAVARGKQFIKKEWKK